MEEKTTPGWREDSLPMELEILIFQLIQTGELLGRISLVCKRWWLLIHSPTHGDPLWQNLLKKSLFSFTRRKPFSAPLSPSADFRRTSPASSSSEDDDSRKQRWEELTWNSWVTSVANDGATWKSIYLKEREYRRTVGIICFENAFKVRICVVDVKGFVRTLQSYTPRNEGGYQRSFAQAKTRRVRAYQSYFRRSFGLLKVKGEEGKDDDEGVRDKLHSRSLINFLEEDTPLQRRPNIGGLVIASKGMIGWQWLDLLDPELQDILLCPPLTDAEEQSKYETIMQQGLVWYSAFSGRQLHSAQSE